MADDSVKARADRRLEGALARTGTQDPRELYRPHLRRLRERDAEAYRQALEHYETKLLPAVAADGSDPLALWLEYGRVLAALCTPGQATQIDPSGLAAPFTPPLQEGHLVLHLPTSARDPAFPIVVPGQPSPAQRATLELLVNRIGTKE